MLLPVRKNVAGHFFGSIIEFRYGIFKLAGIQSSKVYGYSCSFVSFARESPYTVVFRCVYPMRVHPASKRTM
jgi:hypothetical protein